MRRMYSEKFVLDLVARIETLENKVEELEARANYDISLEENTLVIDDLNDNEEE